MKNISLFIGRFNPVHIGHLNTIKYLSDQTKKNHGTAYIGMTNSSDKDKNPLKFKQKLKYMKLACRPFKNVVVSEDPVFTIYEYIRDTCFECQKNGGGKVTFYAGSDRVPSYKKLCADMLKKYQGRGELEDVELEVVEAMERGSFESYSSTKMRQHVKDDDLVSFVDHCPFGSEEDNEKYGTEMFNDVKAAYDNVGNGPQHNITDTGDTWKVVTEIAKKIGEHTNDALGKKDALYTIGGSVRDELMGKTPHDFDLVTTMDYKKYAQLMDTDMVNFRNGLTIVIPVVDGEPFETACLSRGKTIEDRCRQSDLTINSMAKNVLTGEIIDPLGGRDDLKSHTIELTPFMKEKMPEGKQPAAVVRAIRFASVYGWKISDDSMRVLKQFAKKTKGKLDIGQGYFNKNWEKVKKANAEGFAKNLMKQIGVLDYVNANFSDIVSESTNKIKWLKLRG